MPDFDFHFSPSANIDTKKKLLKKNYTRYVPCKKLGIEKDSEKCKQKWKEIDVFYDTVCNGDFIEKYIIVSLFYHRRT
jgi:hypothetical protein